MLRVIGLFSRRPRLVWLLNEALAKAQDDAARHAPLETGGIVLGYEAGNEHVVVTDVVLGGPSATRTRDYFKPDGPWQAEEVARRYVGSGRVTTYLGDWHSHPRGDARPSDLDRTTARAIAMYSEARLPRPTLLILDGRGASWKPHAYTLTGGRLHGARIVPFA
jgi:integrative and conjugative element protein (TIGR02256 family)